MRSGWRGLALVAGGILALGGIALWASSGGPFLLVAAVIALVSALVEPIYGRATAPPRGRDWRPTDEKFVDPESGKLITVWFDPATGERKYVDAE